MPYVLMKLFEQAPRRFDKWMGLLTFGRLQAVREEIARSAAALGVQVLEIGCGPGTMASLLAGRGANVVAIDTSEEMIQEAKGKIEGLEIQTRVLLKNLSAMEIDQFRDETFDRVIAILVLSELTDEEIDYVLYQCRCVLRSSGQLFLVDEIEPERILYRWFLRGLRYPMRLITFLALQARDLKSSSIWKKILYYVIEFPLMLLTFFVVPPATHPISDLEKRVENAGFRLVRRRKLLGGTLRLLQAERLGGVGEYQLPNPPQEKQFATTTNHASGVVCKPTGKSGRAFLAAIRQLPKRLFQTVFRVVPYPTKPGLIRIGNPGRSSPVLVTTNYDLTVRRMCRALKDLDCYLLVAPAGGVDVWCAATGGRFTIESVISILKTSRVGQLVNHRRLILPQLSATGINIFELRKRSGWSAVFGPVRGEDIPEYLATRRRTESMIRVSFAIRERLEMSTAMWGSLSLRYTMFPCLVFGWKTAPWFVLLLAVLCVGVSLGCFTIPGKTFVQKAGLLGLLGAMALVGSLVLPWHLGIFFIIQWTVLIAFASFLAGTAFPSYSPLWPCSYSKLFYGACDLRLTVIEDQCIGCKLCDLVCPVECFASNGNRKMVFADPEICVGCGACLIQCPTDAIINEVAEEHRLETAQG